MDAHLKTHNTRAIIIELEDFLIFEKKNVKNNNNNRKETK